MVLFDHCFRRRWYLARMVIQSSPTVMAKTSVIVLISPMVDCLRDKGLVVLDLPVRHLLVLVTRYMLNLSRTVSVGVAILREAVDWHGITLRSDICVHMTKLLRDLARRHGFLLGCTDLF